MENRTKARTAISGAGEELLLFFQTMLSLLASHLRIA